MNSKDRVKTALLRTGTPDRVPVQFDLCRSLLEVFGRKYGTPVHYTRSYFEDVTYRISANDLRTQMGSDCVIVGGSLPTGYAHPTTADGCVVNEFGMKMRQGPLYMEIVQSPLASVSTPDGIKSFPFPDPLAAGRFDDAEALIRQYRDEYFIIGDLELTMFEMSWHMVGMEKFVMDMVTGEPYVGALLDRVKTFSIGVGKRLVELGVDGIWLGDDVGTQSGMLISPKMWRHILKPRLAEIIAELRASNQSVVIMYHCDGAVAPILGDLAEIGVQVFNPVQPNVPGHEPDALKRQFGERLAFWGAIDQQHLLPHGAPADIVTDVYEKIHILGAGGGYMAAPAHIIQADTSPENVETFIAAVQQHGVYLSRG